MPCGRIFRQCNLLLKQLSFWSDLIYFSCGLPVLFALRRQTGTLCRRSLDRTWLADPSGSIFQFFQQRQSMLPQPLRTVTSPRTPSIPSSLQGSQGIQALPGPNSGHGNRFFFKIHQVRPWARGLTQHPRARRERSARRPRRTGSFCPRRPMSACASAP